MELDVLILTAHPDDAELSIGGTVAKFTKAGYKVGIADMTKGELGTRGTDEIRAKEAADATKILGVQVRENLGVPDGKVKPTEENLQKVIEVVRKYRPKIMLAPYFNDRHPDHIGAGTLAKEAMFFAGLPKIETELNGIKQEAYRPKKLFYFMMTYEFEPSFIVDISDTFETKMNSIRAFKSQFHDPNSDEPETFISKPGFIKFLESRSQYYGFKIRKDYGEPFYCEEDIEIGFPAIFNL